MNEITEGEENEQYVISDDELVSICMREADNSFYRDTDKVSIPLDYYYGRAPALEGCKDPNASTIISMDVRDSVEATVAEIMPAFTGNIVSFDAESAEDEEQAKAEADICNYLLMEQYNGMEVLTTGLKDCLLHRNCYGKVYWDRHSVVNYDSYDNVPQYGIEQLMQPRKEGEEVEVVAHEQVDPPQEAMEQYQQQMQQYEQQAQQAMMQGMEPPPPPEEPQHFSVSLRRTSIVSQPVIESVPPECALIDEALQSVDLDKARFTCHRNIVTRSDLISQGYDREMVEDLSATSYTNIQEYSRNRGNFIESNLHDSVDNIEVFECYIKIDRDGDGIAEMRRVVIADNRLLDDAEWDDTDMVAGVTCLMPHQHEGVSLFDVLVGIQDTKTDILRTVIDGAALASKQRLEATPDVNYDDLLTSTRGGIVRSKRVGSVSLLANPEIPPSVYSTLEMMDKLRRERGGSAVDSSAQTTQIGGDSAHGIERVMSSIELTNAMAARTFSETFVRGIYLRLHALIRKYHQGDISAKIDGQWVSSNPNTWPERDRVSINIGNSQGERLRMAGALGQIQGVQNMMLEKQMITTSSDKLYASSVDMAEYLGVNNPEKYFIDPNSEEGQQAAQQQQQQQEEQAEQAEKDKQFQEQLQSQTVQAQVQVAQAEMGKAQAQMQNNQLKHQIDQLKQQLDQAKTGADLQMEQEKMDRQTALDLLKMELEAQKELDVQLATNKLSVAL